MRCWYIDKIVRDRICQGGYNFSIFTDARDFYTKHPGCKLVDESDNEINTYLLADWNLLDPC